MRFSVKWAIRGVLLAAIPLTTSFAQDRGGGYSEYVIFDEPEPEPTPSPAVTPAPTPTPARPPVRKQRYVPPPNPDLPAYDDPLLNEVTRPELTRFASDREFEAYVDRATSLRRKRQGRWEYVDAGVRRGSKMMAGWAGPQDAGEDCTDPEMCPQDSSAEIVTTATRATPPSITNNQSAGVDEGDIVKQLGDYFLVLQDGRIFAVNTATMKLTDRVDIYRRDKDGKPIGADWYDEMLVQGDHVLITAYSYEDDATELSVFKLDQASGRLARVGVFLISSDDYYDSSNYATRIVGDRLVIYTPYDLDNLVDPDDRPFIRRWQGPEERESDQKRGRALVEPRNLHWPVMRTEEPMAHTVSICPLSKIESRDLNCRTTGFVGPDRVEMFVSPGNVFLWNSAANESLSYRFDDCVADGKVPARAKGVDVAPGVVFRVPVGGGEPDLLAVRGMVSNQFSMDQYRGRFRALVRWQSEKCDQEWDDPLDLALLDVQLGEFGQVYEASPGREFKPVPAPGRRMVENRFVDDWLVYGGRDGWRSYPPEAKDGPQGARAVAVPLRNPKAAQVLEPGHEFVRIERVGNDVMMSGYRDPAGLHVSMIKLAGRAHIGGHVFLPGRFESEGRSHAFNSTVRADGSGFMGVPTVRREQEAGRWVWRSNASDLSFLSFESSGAVADLGSILGAPHEEVAADKGYKCEVSCIDWYGNSRPIFTGNRIFALMGTGLVEVEVRDGAVREKLRIDLTGTIKRN